MPHPSPTSIPRDSFPEPVARYLADLVSTLTQGGFPLANVAVFGSAARSDFAQDVSDVDLIVVLSDDVSVQDRRRVQEEVSRLEVVHGLRPPVSRTKGVLERFIDRAGGNALSSFVCSRSELLAGDMAKVLGCHEPRRCSRIASRLPLIATSAVTAWGEDLVPDVPVPVIRRFEVLKAFFAFRAQLLLIGVAFLVIPEATRHAMGTLKRSLHSCYFCYQLRAGSLQEAVAFFEARLGEPPILQELLALRMEYRDSFGFVLRCLLMIIRLHLRTARENAFPRQAVFSGCSGSPASSDRQA